MFLVPLLALLGVFGKSADSAEARGSLLALRVEYPTRYRFKQIQPVHVTVENLSDAPIDTVVGYDPDEAHPPSDEERLI